MNYLTNVSENTLFKEQDTLDIRSLRKESAQVRAALLQAFVNDRGDDPKLREQLANAYFRLGEITQVIDSSQAALELYRSAMDIWEKLVQAVPDNLEFQSRLADCYATVGTSRCPRICQNRWTGSIGSLRSMSASRPTSRSRRRYQASLAVCCSEIGLCLSRSSEVDTESRLFQPGADTPGEARCRAIPTRSSTRRAWPRSSTAWAMSTSRAAISQRPEDLPGVPEALRGDPRAPVTSGPKPLNLQNLLAKSFFNIATIHRWLEQAGPSLAAAKEAETHWQRLVDVHGSVTAYQVDLSSALWARAWAESRLGQHAQARGLDPTVALGILDRVTKAEPDNLDYLVEQARTLNLKGAIYDNQRQSELARKNFQDAVMLWERILARSSGLDERQA